MSRYEIRYNVGDKVKVKSWNRIKEECGQTVWGYICGTPFNHEVDLMGKIATIKKITKVGVIFEEDAHEYEYPFYLIENKSERENIENFIGNTGYICSKCGKIVIEGKTHENQEGICEDCLIAELQQQLAEKDKYIDELEQEREFMLDEVKNRGTCGLCEKLENKAINVLRDKLKEKDKEIERLKANQTPTRKRLTPKNWDKYNLADKLRYRNSQVKEALIRFSNMNEMEDVLRSQLKDQCHQICEKIREKLKKCVTPTCGTYIVYYEAKNVDDTLDQIEKGGEKE